MTPHLPTSSGFKRTLCAVAALACYAAAIVLTPSGVRSQLDTGGHAALAKPAPHVETPLSAVVPHGDPFAPRAEIDDERPPGALPGLAQVAARSANPLPRRTAAPLTRVTAIAIGSLPTAVVESGGTSRVVTVGDRLDESQITAIDRTAIALANGRRLFLEPPAKAP